MYEPHGSFHTLRKALMVVTPPVHALWTVFNSFSLLTVLQMYTYFYNGPWNILDSVVLVSVCDILVFLSIYSSTLVSAPV